MGDQEAIDAFVNKGAERAFGESLHIEDGVLILDGWWHVCLRVRPDTYIVRGEEPRRETTVMDDIRAALVARGLKHVATDLPGITVLTMNRASLGYVSWEVWGTDLPAAEAALSDAVNEDSFLQQGEYYEGVTDRDYSSELRGARRLSGLASSLILTVGIDANQMSRLETSLDDCNFITKKFGEIEPDVCGSLVPTLILVDASEQHGKEFVMRLRSACSRLLPVVAVTHGADTPLGADAAVAADEDATAWATPIRNLLP
ncbi:MAG: hypothetical protein ACRD12_13220 [Acidimicrobiales bacterium]